jgi:hypothetical protein
MLEAMFGEHPAQGLAGERQSLGDIPAQIDGRVPQVVQVDEMLVSVWPAADIQVIEALYPWTVNLKTPIADNPGDKRLHFGVGSDRP